MMKPLLVFAATNMRGADKIIQLRMQGRKPPVINLWDYPFVGELELSHVVIHNLSTGKLDLRFVLDCLVCVYSDTRAKEIADICKANGARQVAYEPSTEIIWK